MQHPVWVLSKTETGCVLVLVVLLVYLLFA
jgi:hypothetical protein